MTETTDPILLKARIKRLEKALEPFAALGRYLQPVKEKLGILHAGDSARSSSCWHDYEEAAKALYGDVQELAERCGTEGYDERTLEYGARIIAEKE